MSYRIIIRGQVPGMNGLYTTHNIAPDSTILDAYHYAWECHEEAWWARVKGLTTLQ